MLKEGDIVLVMSRDSYFNVKHYTDGRIGRVIASKLGRAGTTLYELKIFYPGGAFSYVKWFTEYDLLYLSDDVNNISDLEKLIYDFS